MNNKLVSQKTTLSGFMALCATLLPAGLQAHGIENDHLHGTSDLSMWVYAALALGTVYLLSRLIRFS